jgi:hypothetical protein
MSPAVLGLVTTGMSTLVHVPESRDSQMPWPTEARPPLQVATSFSQPSPIGGSRCQSNRGIGRSTAVTDEDGPVEAGTGVVEVGAEAEDGTPAVDGPLAEPHPAATSESATPNARRR